VDYRNNHSSRWGVHCTLIQKKQLIIVGAGGFGREVYSWLTQHPENNNKWTIKGFIDDNAEALLNLEYSVGIIGKITGYIPKENELLVLGIGVPKTKERIVKYLKERKAQFYTLIHPTSILGTNVKIGEGAIICPYSLLTNDINVGDFVTINANSTVGHDVSINDFTTLSGHCDVTGHCKVGKGVFMGSHATVTPKTVVEDYAFIGAGSVGIRKVKANTTILGVPGKKIY
jgi:sugar O-acyltransferase (sialic acid O-acetyltransferase NeuD family)